MKRLLTTGVVLALGLALCGTAKADNRANGSTILRPNHERFERGPNVDRNRSGYFDWWWQFGGDELRYFDHWRLHDDLRYFDHWRLHDDLRHFDQWWLDRDDLRHFQYFDFWRTHYFC